MKTDWKDSSWLMWLMLFILWPFGVYLLYKKRDTYKKWKIIAAGTLLFWVFFIVNGDNKNIQKNEQPTKIEQKVDKNVIAIEKGTGLDQDKSEKIYNLITQVGIKNVNNLTHLDKSDNDTEKMYCFSSDIADKIFLYISPSGELQSIRYNAENLYSNGAVNYTIDQFILTFDQKNMLNVRIQELVLNQLKAPSTADFPSIDKWIFMKSPTTGIVVQSYVDAQNSFGAKLRTNFKIVLSDDEKTIKSFTLGGNKII